MQRRAFLLSLAALAVGSAAVGACTSGAPMTVGIHPWPGYEPLYLARAFGWLPEGVHLREGQAAGGALAPAPRRC